MMCIMGMITFCNCYVYVILDVLTICLFHIRMQILRRQSRSLSHCCLPNISHGAWCQWALNKYDMYWMNPLVLCLPSSSLEIPCMRKGGISQVFYSPHTEGSPGHGILTLTLSHMKQNTPIFNTLWKVNKELLLSQENDKNSWQSLWNNTSNDYIHPLRGSLEEAEGLWVWPNTCM